MQPNPPSNGRSGAVQFFWLTLIFGAVAYTIYACYTRTGVAGYAMKLQFDLWHSASEGTTVLLTIALVSMALAAAVAVAHGMFPSMRIFRADAVSAMNRPLGPISWKVVLVASALPLVVGAVISAFWYRSEQLDATAQVYSVDLTAAPSALPKDARFVEVTGRIARPAILTYKKTEDQKVTHEIFAPLVASDSREPVRYVLHHEALEQYDGSVAWPDPFLRRGATQFSGRVGWSLPAFAESGLRSKGVTLDAHYTVIDWKDLSFPNMAGAGSDQMWLIPLAACGLISIVTFPMMLVVRFKLNRLRRAQAAAGVRF